MSSTSKEPSNLAESLQPTLPTSDFADPYSDLSLFLSQKIKEQVQEEGGIFKKWSIFLQNKLIAKIGPEFEKKFPQCRLGVHAIRKTFEKIVYYHEQIGKQKEAITQDGRVNLSYLIKENLRHYFHYKNSSELHPYHFAHQLAMKLSDCMATMEGARPMLDHLARTIWAVQRHMLPSAAIESAKSPYDEFDRFDRLIVKTMLEISGKHPQISQKELEEKVKEAILELKELPGFASFDQTAATISALLAERLYPTSSLYLLEQKTAIFNFIRRHLKLCKASSPIPLRSEWVRRTAALYTLASSLPKDIDENGPFPQSMKALLAAEEQMQASEKRHVLYEEVKGLPLLSSDCLEMAIWKVLSEEEELLKELPYRVGLKLEEEIAYLLIEHPNMHFKTIVDRALQFFIKAKELSVSKKWTEIEKKISLWTLQGDLVCHWLKIDPENSLLSQIVELVKVQTAMSHAELISEATQCYLRRYPNLVPYTPQLAARVSILYKYVWYATLALSEESSFDRFLAWHQRGIPKEKAPDLLEEICKKTLPLIPFDKSSLAAEEKEAEKHKRHA